MSPPPSIPRGDDRWRARTAMGRGACRTTPEWVAARLRMPRNTSPTADATPAVAFEVERFGWTAADRIEGTGRWFGLRGHRFMRPALIVEAGDDRRRMLALLEHKPWAADEGEEWVAAFPWQGERVEGAAAGVGGGPGAAARGLAVPPGAAVAPPLPIGRKRRRGSARAQGPASRSARPQRAPARP